MGSGWDNVMMRLGTHLLVRLPRRAIAAILIEEEQRWLPELSSRLPIDVPVPVHVGRSSRDYPWPWSIVRWLPGEGADRSPPDADESCRLASFLSCLHQAAPAGARVNPVRGVPLATRADQLGERMERLAWTTDAITPAVRAAWHSALAASPDYEPLWLHGDLHPLNILVRQGRITGIIDWGDLTAGDVATDLAVFWMLFDEPTRERALAAYGRIDNPMRARAMGWAVLFGAMLCSIPPSWTIRAMPPSGRQSFVASPPTFPPPNALARTTTRRTLHLFESPFSGWIGRAVEPLGERRERHGIRRVKPLRGSSAPLRPSG